MVYSTATLLININIAYTSILVMCLFKTIKLKTGILANKSFYNLSSKEVSVVNSMITEKELSLSSFFQYYQHTTVNHHINIRTKDIDNLNSTINLHILWNINKQTILRKHSVQRSNSILVCLCKLSIILAYKFRILSSYIT